MSIDKKKIGKILKVTAIGTGVTFLGLNMIAKKKKGDSVFEKEKDQKNPFAGKKVVFVEDESDEENADGVRGHLEAVGETKKSKGIYDRYIKRAIDVVLSFGGLVVLSPIYAGIAIAIKIDDPGPVFFTQKRVGQNKEFFKIHKFRSMKMSTPHDVPTHMLGDPDQYITRVGKFLRKHSLDELPQIWDIFIGNMSVIGPRPALWNQDVLIAEREKYHANDVKPGLTGWAQINGRDELEIPVKAKLDGEYVEKESLLFDIKCFLGTIGKVAKDDSVVEGGTGEMSKHKDKALIITNHSYMLYQFRRELIQKMQENYEVVISMPFVGRENYFQEMGYHCIETEIDRRGINPITDLKLLNTYSKMIKKEKPDLVITYSIKPNIYAGIVCRFRKVPYVANVQGLGTAFQKRVLSYLVTVLYKFAFKKVKIVFFENQANAEEFQKRRIIPLSKQTILSGAGVNLEYYPYEAYPHEKEKIHFLFVGRIMKEKGVDELFASMKQLKEEYKEKVVLNLVGFFEDEYKIIVERLVEDQTVIFHGFQEDPRPYYKMTHCVVLPSYHEGMSNVLLEAAASGRPIITSDIPGCRESVVNGETGYLCKAKDKESLYEKMNQFIQLPYEKKEMMGKSGRAKMEKEFDKKIVVQETINRIDSLSAKS